jgi:hypothetical protein
VASLGAWHPRRCMASQGAWPPRRCATSIGGATSSTAQCSAKGAWLAQGLRQPDVTLPAVAREGPLPNGGAVWCGKATAPAGMTSL